MPPKSFNEFLLDSGDVEYEEQPVPAGKGAAAAVLSLLPIALGAAFKGKQGANAGSRAALASASILKEGWDKEQNRELTKALRESSSKSSLARLLYAQNRQDERFNQSQENMDQRRELNAQDAMERMKFKMENGQGNQAVSLPEAEVLIKSFVDGSLMSKEDAVKLLDQAQQGKLSNKFFTNFNTGKFAAKGAANAVGYAESVGMQADKNANKLREAQFHPNVDWTVEKPSDANIKKASTTYQAHEFMRYALGEVKKLYEENRGVPYTQWGDSIEAAKRRILSSAALVDWANVKERGANFTWMEMELGRDALASPRSFVDYIGQRLLGMTPEKWAQAADASLQINEGLLKNQLASLGAYIKGDQYDPESARRNGIPVDANGIAQPTGNIDRLIGEFEASGKKARNAASIFAPESEKTRSVSPLQGKIGGQFGVDPSRIRIIKKLP